MNIDVVIHFSRGGVGFETKTENAPHPRILSMHARYVLLCEQWLGKQKRK